MPPIHHRPAAARAARAPRHVPAAIVYCEGNFARIDGKTANGLARHSEAYRIVAVIDSAHAGSDAGKVLDGTACGIPILADLAAAAAVEPAPEVLIYGMAPSTGRLSPSDRAVVLEAISMGMGIVSGLHEHLGDDPEIAAAADAAGVVIRDIRKPKPAREMRLFVGSVADMGAIRVAVLGTDCAIGKRTTAVLLTRALNAAGITAAMVGTGQTGLMQGARFGAPLDAIPPQFCCGELEGAILAAWEAEAPRVIVIEGQGALSHPAFCTSAFVLRGSQPHGVILQHAPARTHRCDFPDMPMPDPVAEIALIEAFAPTRVIGVALNHEGMHADRIGEAIETLSAQVGLPVTDPLTRHARNLVDMVLAAHPSLGTDPVRARRAA